MRKQINDVVSSLTTIENGPRRRNLSDGSIEVISREGSRNEMKNAFASVVEEKRTNHMIVAKRVYEDNLLTDRQMISDALKRIPVWEKSIVELEGQIDDYYIGTSDNISTVPEMTFAQEVKSGLFSKIGKFALGTLAIAIVYVTLAWSGAIPMVFAGTTDNGVPQELVDTIIEPGMAPMPDGAPNATPPGVHDPKAPSA